MVVHCNPPHLYVSVCSVGHKVQLVLHLPHTPQLIKSAVYTMRLRYRPCKTTVLAVIATQRWDLCLCKESKHYYLLHDALHSASVFAKQGIRPSLQAYSQPSSSSSARGLWQTAKMLDAWHQLDHAKRANLGSAPIWRASSFRRNCRAVSFSSRLLLLRRSCSSWTRRAITSWTDTLTAP